MKPSVEPISTQYQKPVGVVPTAAGYVSSATSYHGLGYHSLAGQLTPASSSTSSLLNSNSDRPTYTPPSETSADSRGELNEYFQYGESHRPKASMNHHHQPYLSNSPTHISGPPSYSAQPQTAGEMSHYSQYQHASSMPGSGGSYSHGSYQYYGGVTSPQSATQPSSGSMSNQLAPLPLSGMSHGHSSFGSSASHPQSGFHQELQRQPPQQQQHHFDVTGQVPPPGVKPRVTATLWEDEGSLCFQVEAKGVCVARREDNHFINGTKLLNVAGMTRGRRDGILKSEKTRHVVKIGPMHLKGVWIPYERALDFANREKITELLYPLFVHNISALLYHPGNPTRPASSMDANRRKDSQRALPASIGVSSAPSSAGLHHHHSMNGQLSTQSPIGPPSSNTRPEINRAHTFPTPPTSASAIIPPQPNSNSYDWGSQNLSGSVSGSQPLTIETGMHNSRSMPSTPATTPPANSLQSIPSYPTSGSYSGNYTGTPHTPSQFTTPQQNIARFGPPMSSHSYVKSEMGPPSRDNTTTEVDHGHDAIEHGTGDEGDHDGDYQRYASSQAPFNYTPTSTMGAMPEHSHLANDHDTSPHAASGRVTPRNSVSHATWNSGYNTPPRTGTSVSHGYVMGDSRTSLTNGHTVGDAYGAASAYGMSSAKRGRDDEDDYKTHGGMGDSLDLKRRKSNREGSITGAPVGGYEYQHPRSTILQGASR